MKRPELSEKTINKIKNTAKLIVAKDTEITSRMYEILFAKYPDIKEMFANAPKDQYKRLAEVIASYAMNIDNIKIFYPALETIAKIHVQHNVKPKHYPAVGMAMIEAFEDVMGDGDPELIDAWREAYLYLGSILVEMEKKLYLEQNKEG